MFKKLFLVTFCFSMLSVSNANAKTITAHVNGLVCEFCVSTLHKSFSEIEAIEDINVDLERKLITLNTYEGQDVSDETIKSVIVNNGYNVDKIER